MDTNAHYYFLNSNLRKMNYENKIAEQEISKAKIDLDFEHKRRREEESKLSFLIQWLRLQKM